jgi:integrase
VSGVGLHTLRHSIATHILAAGVPPHTVSELLGHSFVAVTGDVSGHVSNDGALCRPAALSSNGQLRMCAMATRMATRQQRGRLGFCPKRPLTCCFPSG